MSASQTSDSPTVLLVARDRALLRHLARFLNTFGYQVEPVAETGLALALLATEPPQLMIVDGEDGNRSAIDFCRKAAGSDCNEHTHILLLVRSLADVDVAEALEAGVDDFLTKPVVYGELLARLRAGARAWQFEDRARRQRRVDAVTGLPGAAALHQRINRILSASTDALEVACVALDLDFFGRMVRVHGRVAGEEVRKRIAGILGDACDETIFPAALGSARFGCLLTGKSEEEAADWAENLRGVIAQTAWPLEGTTTPLSLSASFGISSQIAEYGSADELIARAVDALRRAKLSGRNCIVCDGELAEEERDWADRAAPGKLFERSAARDVMTPNCLVLRQGEPATVASTLLDRTRLDLIALVDGDGRYAGAVAAEDLLDDPPAACTDQGVPSFEAETPLVTLLEFFARRGGRVAVIVEQGKPIGYVTAQSLAELTVPPSLASAEWPQFGSNYLAGG
ncbi:MAG: diguanylate cyclase [Rhodopirellula sp.]|nr:diguanylate cyclase [Rhodopirellula sp.]